MARNRQLTWWQTVLMIVAALLILGGLFNLGAGWGLVALFGGVAVIALSAWLWGYDSRRRGDWRPPTG
jgi:hypothetical protein